MTTSTYQQTAAVNPFVKAGALAGLGGGLMFGLMMGMMGMLPMIAQMAGSSSAVFGFVLHMGISAFIGAVYGIVARRLPDRLPLHLAAGGVNGLLWWVLGALLLMPLALGMPGMVFTIGQPQMMSLMGHLVYGVLTALLYKKLSS